MHAAVDACSRCSAVRSSCFGVQIADGGSQVSAPRRFHPECLRVFHRRPVRRVAGGVGLGNAGPAGGRRTSDRSDPLTSRIHRNLLSPRLIPTAMAQTELQSCSLCGLPVRVRPSAGAHRSSGAIAVDAAPDCASPPRLWSGWCLAVTHRRLCGAGFAADSLSFLLSSLVFFTLPPRPCSHPSPVPPWPSLVF